MQVTGVKTHLLVSDWTEQEKPGKKSNHDRVKQTDVGTVTVKYLQNPSSSDAVILSPTSRVPVWGANVFI